MSWLTIESDPFVFTTLIEDLSVKGITVEEVFSIDADSLNALRKPIYGVIFLFKFQGSAKHKHERTSQFDQDESLWFSSQVIPNACATQAILSILLNSPDIELGSELSAFRDFTQAFPYDLRGEAMSNSEMLRSVHNSFAKAEMFSMDSTAAEGEGETPYHFIAYSTINGSLYELDGLQEAPINHGPCTEAQFGEHLAVVLQERISRYTEGEIGFNLLSITKDRLVSESNLDPVEKDRLEQVRAQRHREVELRRFNFAAAIVALTKVLVKRHGTDLESLLRSARERTTAKRQSKS